MKVSKKSDEYLKGLLSGENDVVEGWFDPADYTRVGLVNHLVSCDNYSLEFLEGYCDGAFGVNR